MAQILHLENKWQSLNKKKYKKELKREEETKGHLKSLIDYIDKNYEGGLNAMLQAAGIDRKIFDSKPDTAKVRELKEIVPILIKQKGGPEPRPEPRFEKEEGMLDFLQRKFPKYKQPKREEELEDINPVKYLVSLMEREEPGYFQTWLNSQPNRGSAFLEADQEEQVRILEKLLSKFMEDIPVNIEKNITSHLG